MDAATLTMTSLVASIVRHKVIGFVDAATDASPNFLMRAFPRHKVIGFVDAATSSSGGNRGW